MKSLVHIESGQWVLTFYQPYFPPDRDMKDHLECFTTWGGGWDGHRADEIFLVHQVEVVKPKTYITPQHERFFRSHVVAGCATEKDAVCLRDRFFAIGRDATKAIEAEMHRLVKPFAKQKQADALEQIHAALPHIFGRDA